MLARAAVFAGLGAEDLADVAARVEPIDVPAGTTLCEEGSPPEALYVIADGELSVYKRVAGGDETLVNVCGPGEVIGEMSLLEQLPRSASVRATRPSRVLRLAAPAFDELVRTRPAIALAILRVVTARLRNTEAVLRQFDKLTALGKIAAGIAHELNNPAAALVRGAATLETTVQSMVELAPHAATAPGARPVALGPLERSEREAEVEAALGRHGVDDAWSLAPALVGIGWRAADVDAFAARLGPGASAGLRWTALARTAEEIIGELKDAAQRISTIVASVRTYSYLGAAPVTRVDVREGIETALTLLAHRLRGLRVARDFAPEAPIIEAHGSELNQVWTNLLDNAIDAAGPSGSIEIAVAPAPRGIAVTITDDGPGIPAEVLPRLFEPFFTTKPPGSGTGLGLHIAYDVVVRKHRGQIDVASRPGRTAFRVELPLRPGGEGTG